MKNIRKIEYQQLNFLDLLAIYLACKAIKAGKSGIFLTNDALRNLFSVSRIHQAKVDDLIKGVRRIFPYAETVRWGNSRGVVLWATKEPNRKYEKVTQLPTEEGMLSDVGFKTCQMTLESAGQ